MSTKPDASALPRAHALGFVQMRKKGFCTETSRVMRILKENDVGGAADRAYSFVQVDCLNAAELTTVSYNFQHDG